MGPSWFHYLCIYSVCQCVLSGDPFSGVVQGFGDTQIMLVQSGSQTPMKTFSEDMMRIVTKYYRQRWEKRTCPCQELDSGCCVCVCVCVCCVYKCMCGHTVCVVCVLCLYRCVCVLYACVLFVFLGLCVLYVMSLCVVCMCALSAHVCAMSV